MKECTNTFKSATKTAPKPGVLPRPATAEPIARKSPQYHVILHDDDMHTYHYVIVMLMQLFGKTQEAAFEHACEVDKSGVTIVETTTLERAELKRDQIKAFGRDPLIPKSQSGMYASIEPAD